MALCPAHLADPPGTWTLPIAGPHTDHHRRALCRGRLPTLPSNLRDTSLRPSYKADGAGVRAPSQSHRKAGSGSKGREAGRAEQHRGAVSPGPARHPLQGTPEAKRMPPGNHPFPIEPVLTPHSQPSTSGRVSSSSRCADASAASTPFLGVAPTKTQT